MLLINDENVISSLTEKYPDYANEIRRCAWKGYVYADDDMESIICGEEMCPMYAYIKGIRKRRMYVRFVHVAANKRNQHVGTKLLEALMQAAINDKCDDIVVTCDYESELCNFFESNVFTPSRITYRRKLISK